jgi:hypothetical protein
LEHPVLKTAFSTRFEGVMLGGIGRWAGPYPAPQGTPSGGGGGPPTGGSLKTLLVQTETDVQLFDGKAVRGQSANYRCYEIAGAAHNPTSLVPLSQYVGLPGVSASTRQNPLAIGPVVRCMMEHLRNWIEGNGTPPDSVTLGNPFNVANHVDFTPAIGGVEHIRDVPRAASTGAATGGIRLPPIVVPLGLHDGIETAAGMPYSATTLGQMISGVFVPFGTAVLAARYPPHGADVDADAAAADAALDAGWILAPDRDAYVATAQASAVGTGVALTPEQLLACFDL